MKYMWYTYILISFKNKKLYVGYTSDLKKRFERHNSRQGGKYTSRNSPFSLVYYEAFLTKEEAVKQEKFYKSGYGKEVLKSKIGITLKKFGYMAPSSSG
ncbi:MAG: GIY-YIG nuclease family protein [Candidatus Portnoybacteria bacterium]|nr:GIY-YIG nuclease family protein [Candidatus Portnoybacteria bacterium]